VLLDVGFLVQLGKLSEIEDFQAGAGASYEPIVTYITLFGAIGGIVIFGRPYALASVQFLCFLIGVVIYVYWPGLFEWWDLFFDFIYIKFT
jgi:hypothetical protein